MVYDLSNERYFALHMPPSMNLKSRDYTYAIYTYTIL